MSGESDWRRRRISGRDQLNRPGEPPNHGRAREGNGPGRAGAGSGPEPTGPALRSVGPADPGRTPDRGTPGSSDGGRDDVIGGFTLHEDSLDLGEVGFDENFLDALSKDAPVPTRDHAEFQLAEMLSSWRHEIVSTPADTPPVSVEDVERAIASAERAGRGRRMVRHLRVVSGAAAIVIVAAAGLTVLSEGSQPGDPLWGIKEVVFAEAASETQAAHDVRSNLERAEAAIAAGDPLAASRLLSEVEGRMGPLRDSELRDELSEWMNRLRAGVGLPSPKAPAPGGPADQSVVPTAPAGPSGVDPSVPTDALVPPDGSGNPSAPPPIPTTGENPSTTPSAPPTQMSQPSPSSSSNTVRRPADIPAIPWTPPDIDAGRPIG